ncbi:MAG: glycoside hydrolase family 32 protein [Eudoraea sp.]
MKNKLLIGLCLICWLHSCRDKKSENIEIPVDRTLVETYKERYRPQYHFTPEKMWMNDPNGLVYHEGIYHLFYQYYPDDIVWGPMHWGHAISKDMVHWEQKPIALYPDEHGLIFSGSAVVDLNNTSGLGSKENPPLVAIYTYHDMKGEKEGALDFQTQGIAYSLDNGESWVKYDKNPVILNEGIKDFRDPKVFWHEETEHWILVLVAGDYAQIYNSKNLKEWTLLSDFGKEVGAHGGVWECPDLFPLKIAETGEEKWVMIISINPGAPNGGSGTQYFIGDFDGTNFTSDQKAPKWLDWGTDNYAGVTYNNVPSGERIFIGWMSNWDYARNTPTEKWRSAMTLPRNLSLSKINGEYTLINYPLEGLASLKQSRIKKELNLAPQEKEVINFDNYNQAEVRFQTSGRYFDLTFSNASEEQLVFLFDQENEELILDRTSSGQTSFKETFGDKLHKMPLENLPSGNIEVRILMDWSSVEIFINKGQKVMTSQIFPKDPYNVLTFTNLGAEGLSITDIEISKIEAIW